MKIDKSKLDEIKSYIDTEISFTNGDRFHWKVKIGDYAFIMLSPLSKDKLTHVILDDGTDVSFNASEIVCLIRREVTE